MNCNFCMKTLDEFIRQNNLTARERIKVVHFAMFMESKRLERSIERSITPLQKSNIDVIC